MENKAHIQSYLEKMKDIEEILLSFLDNEENDETNYNQLNKILNDQKIHENKNELKLILHLISTISTNHHKANFSYAKIERVLKLFEEDIKNFFSNFSVFNIFKKNKRILLYLFEEKIIVPDESICYIITSKKYKQRFYPHYFFNEFKSFLSEELQSEIKENCAEITNNDSTSFEQKRKNGVNDKLICQLIQNDSLSEFISYCDSEKVEYSTEIETSLFETNHFLLKNKSSLIEYSAFYGSLQIFKHLLSKNAELKPSLWLFAIHGNNEELIRLLNEKVPITLYKDCIRESIKCHNNKLLEYINDNSNKHDEPFNNYYFCQGLKFYNFIEFTEKISEDIGRFLKFCHNDYNSNKPQLNIFYDFCKFDYISIVDYYFKTHKGIVNPDSILKLLSFSYNFFLTYFFNRISEINF